MKDNEHQTRDEFGELYIDELGEVRGGIELPQGLVPGLTLGAAGAEGFDIPPRPIGPSNPLNPPGPTPIVPVIPDIPKPSIPLLEDGPLPWIR